MNLFNQVLLLLWLFSGLVVYGFPYHAQNNPLEELTGITRVAGEILLLVLHIVLVFPLVMWLLAQHVRNKM